MGWQSWPLPHSAIKHEQGSARLGEMDLETNFYLSSGHRDELSRGILGSRWVIKNTGFELKSNCLCVCFGCLRALLKKSSCEHTGSSGSRRNPFKTLPRHSQGERCPPYPQA